MQGIPCVFLCCTSGCACICLIVVIPLKVLLEVENEDTCLITAALASCCLGPLIRRESQRRERGSDRAIWVITRQRKGLMCGIWSEDGSQGLQPSKQEPVMAMLTITQ